MLEREAQATRERFQMRKLTVLSSFIVSVLMLGLTPTQAANEKVDVCHSEGNGSFHLINVSVNAVAAHLRHGDALPNEAVPGNPGYIFDEACELALASTCPCHFSAGDLAEIKVDGDSGGTEVCSRGSNFGDFVLVCDNINNVNNPLCIPGVSTDFADFSQAHVRGISYGDEDQPGRVCARRGPDGAFIEKFSGLTRQQTDDCVADLERTAICMSTP